VPSGAIVASIVSLTAVCLTPNVTVRRELFLVAELAWPSCLPTGDSTAMDKKAHSAARRPLPVSASFQHIALQCAVQVALAAPACHRAGTRYRAFLPSQRQGASPLHAVEHSVSSPSPTPRFQLHRFARLGREGLHFLSGQPTSTPAARFQGSGLRPVSWLKAHADLS